MTPALRALRALRDYVHSQDWAPFMAGYRAALRDIERTGLKPTGERTIRYSAERAFSDTYGTAPRRREPSS